MANTKVQVKYTIDSYIVSAFKKRCASEGVSMTSEISKFMVTHKPRENLKITSDTRPLRKKAVKKIVELLNDIMQKEEIYQDSIPEQFQQRYETAEHSCEQLSQAISCLDDAY